MESRMFLVTSVLLGTSVLLECLSVTLLFLFAQSGIRVQLEVP